ncbi:MAG TPA: DNA polymerase III subunit delta [Actinomycetota bacterium]|nr:DNA polymerase III subunit delta [Actinomycetota bacterium]
MSIGPVVLLSGDEFLAEEALAKIRMESQADPLAEASFGSKVPVHELAGALDTPSLLGGMRLVVLRDAQDLPKETAEALLSYLQSPSSSTVLVLVATGRTKLDAAARKAGAVVSLEPPKGRRLASWIRARAGEKKLKIDDRAAWALIDAIGGDLRDLDGALDQLLTARGPGAVIGVRQVRDAFARSADERIYVFSDAVGDRRLDVAMGTLRRLLEQGEEPLVVFGALAAQIRRMIRAHGYAARGSSAVADALGLPGWRAERLARQAGSYREDELVNAMSLLARVDVDLKGELPPEGKVAALEGAVVRIVERA